MSFLEFVQKFTDCPQTFQIVQILKLPLHSICSNKLIKTLNILKENMVYLSNCKSQQKLYQEQLFYSSSTEAKTTLFMYLFIHLDYTHLL